MFAQPAFQSLSSFWPLAAWRPKKTNCSTARSSAAPSFATSGSCQSKKSACDCQPPTLLTLTPCSAAARARTAFSRPSLAAGSKKDFWTNIGVPKMTERLASSLTSIAHHYVISAADTIRPPKRFGLEMQVVHVRPKAHEEHPAKLRIVDLGGGVGANDQVVHRENRRRDVEDVIHFHIAAEAAGEVIGDRA